MKKTLLRRAIEGDTRGEEGAIAESVIEADAIAKGAIAVCHGIVSVSQKGRFHEDMGAQVAAKNICGHAHFHLSTYAQP